MNAIVHTAYVLDAHRAADLNRENEQLRALRERGSASPARRFRRFPRRAR